MNSACRLRITQINGLRLLCRVPGNTRVTSYLVSAATVKANIAPAGLDRNIRTLRTHLAYELLVRTRPNGIQAFEIAHPI